MQFSRLAKQASKALADNSPVILTALGVTGTVTTAYLAGKASFKAPGVLRDEEERRERVKIPVLEARPITPRQKFELLWKLYIPAVASGTATVCCIIAANYVGTKRAAALAAAYTLSAEAAAEYRRQVVNRIGAVEEREVTRAVAQQQVREKPPTSLVLVGDGDVLCHDATSGRYFKSDKETLRRAANDIAYQVLHSDFATVEEFYKKIKLEPTSSSSEFGWNTENQIELLFSPVETPDGRPCLSFDFAVIPVYQPWQFR